jgi:hypothetical protein
MCEQENPRQREPRAKKFTHISSSWLLATVPVECEPSNVQQGKGEHRDEGPEFVHKAVIEGKSCSV